MAEGVDEIIYDEDDYTDLCMEFDTKYNKWSQVARMNEVRSYAASAVFEGKVVVSGGNFGEIKNTVEAYDRVDNSWTPMPNMIKRRNGHASVGMRNKLFVIGCEDARNRSSCEVFDSNSEKFVALKKPPSLFVTRYGRVVNAILIRSEIILFHSDYPTTALFYDVEKNEWSERKVAGSKNLYLYCCAITPQLKF